MNYIQLQNEGQPVDDVEYKEENWKRNQKELVNPEILQELDV
jgi:hypothetical protein